MGVSQAEMRFACGFVAPQIRTSRRCIEKDPKDLMEEMLLPPVSSLTCDRVRAKGFRLQIGTYLNPGHSAPCRFRLVKLLGIGAKDPDGFSRPVGQKRKCGISAGVSKWSRKRNLTHILCKAGAFRNISL